MHSAIELRTVSKTFGRQRALADVSVSFAAGRVTALLGKNGSGKSTLIKILAGYYEPDAGDGEILVKGEPVSTPVDPRVMHRLGVRFLHQDPAIVQGMSVSDNFQLVNGFSARSPVSRIHQAKEERAVAEVLEKFDVGARPQELMSSLAPAQQTMVAIARAFATGNRPTVILDEPTASLPQSEVEKVFAALRLIVQEGGSVIYVSHRLDEVRQIANDLVVLRDGQVVAAEEAADRSSRDIVEMILGHAPVEIARPPAPRTGDPILVATGLVGQRLHDIDLTVSAGEIVGVTGLLGCGRSELARMVAGAQRPLGGTMKLIHEAYEPTSSKAARRLGVGYVPQDRRREGVVAGMNLRENLTLSVLPSLTRRGVIRASGDRRLAADAVKRFGIAPPNPDAKIDTLSGGNQQKSVFARNSMLELKLLVLDEPTQGVDIGAKAEIVSICTELAASGVGVLLASSDFDELADVCHRVVVLDRGAVVDELRGAAITVSRITSSCFSGQLASAAQGPADA
jgi:ribose transport system ATP-binding protein